MMSRLSKLREKWRPVAATIVASLAGIFVAIFLVRGIWSSYLQNGTGFLQKDLWDWLALLIVPIVLAVGGYFFRRAERRSETEIAEARAKIDRSISGDRLEEEALQQYLDRMTELLLKEKLLSAPPGDEVHAVARARTLTVLRRLDGTRKGLLLRFLFEVGLINRETADS